MSKYDGWTVKCFWGGKPFLIIGYFHQTRRAVIEDFEKSMGDSWRKFRRRGLHKIVKIKFTEVD